jgi:hypothetical protein
MTGATSMRERRKHARYPTTIPVEGRLFDVTGRLQSFEAETVNVSREGLAVISYGPRLSIGAIGSLLSDNKPVSLTLQLPQAETKITTTGKIRWYQVDSLEEATAYLIAGVFAEHMEQEDRTQWNGFIEYLAQMPTRPEA